MYGISGEGTEMFKVHTDTGTIQMRCDATDSPALDRESQDQFNINIEATDTAGHKARLSRYIA